MRVIPILKTIGTPVAILATLFLTTGCNVAVQDDTPETSTIGQMSDPQFMYGVNVSHYLSQIGDHGFANPEYFAEEDMSWIAGKGYDHIRLPVDGHLIFDEQGNPIEENLAKLDETLGWASKYNLNVILDVHKLEGNNFSGERDERLFHEDELQAKAIVLWQFLANRYKDHGPDLRFEILNEPTAEDSNDVTRFYERVLVKIREISPERTIVVCSNRWGQFGTVAALEPLFKYGNLVVAVHFYEPHVFTHQKASWVGSDVPGIPPIPFPGTVPDLTPFLPEDHYCYDKSGSELTVEEIAHEFQTLMDWAAGHDIELHLGEFGVYDRANPVDRENWYRAVLDQCQKHDLGWAIWDYQGGFAVRDRVSKDPTIVQEVLDEYID